MNRDDKGPAVAEFVNPPIPSRNFDWCATREGYDEGDPMGWGSTRKAAINALKGIENETY
jgi:hypothetical protein